MDIEEEDNQMTRELERFAELKEVCQNLRFDEEWKCVSQVMADRLMRRGEYGLAASMCLQAEDGYALSRIAERVVDSFVSHGKLPHSVNFLVPKWSLTCQAQRNICAWWILCLYPS